MLVTSEYKVLVSYTENNGLFKISNIAEVVVVTNYLMKSYGHGWIISESNGYSLTLIK